MLWRVCERETVAETVSRELTASLLRGERKRVGGGGMRYEINNCMMRADTGGGRVGWGQCVFLEGLQTGHDWSQKGKRKKK